MFARCTLLTVVSTLLAMNSAVARAEDEVAFGPPEPTEHHQVLAREAGYWIAEVTYWPQGPDGPAAKSKGTEMNEVVGDGMWLVSEFHGAFGDKAFTGYGQYGYDPVKKKYVGTWIDTMSPYLSIIEGTYNKEKDTFTFISETRDPHTGEKTKTRSMSKFIDKDHREFTVYAPADKEGNKVRVLHIAYTRKGEK